MFQVILVQNSAPQPVSNQQGIRQGASGNTASQAPSANGSDVINGGSLTLYYKTGTYSPEK